MAAACTAFKYCCSAGRCVVPAPAMGGRPSDEPQRARGTTMRHPTSPQLPNCICCTHTSHNTGKMYATFVVDGTTERRKHPPRQPRPRRVRRRRLSKRVTVTSRCCVLCAVCAAHRVCDGWEVAVCCVLGEDARGEVVVVVRGKCQAPAKQIQAELCCKMLCVRSY